MAKNVIAARGFRQHKLFAVTAIVTMVALLLMIPQVAESVVSAGSSLGLKMPNTNVLRIGASHVFLAGSGLLLFLVSAMIVVPLVKFALIGAGLALLGYGVYNLYKMIQGQAVHDVLPRK